MTLKTTPWAIGGGALHDTSLGRTLSYVGSNGEQGVIQPADLKVGAQTTPAASVAVAGGAAILLGNYPNQTSQSYIARNDGPETVAIPATSGSARADLIILRVDDPEYSGTVPTDVVTHPYARFERIGNVAAGATTAGVAYPHIVLARVNVPASTSAITNAMITDLRKVANPRRKRVIQVTGGPVTPETLTVTAAGGETWPDNASWQVEVPAWATRVQAVAHWSGLLAPGVAGGANFGADLRVRLGASLDIAVGLIDRPSTVDSMRMGTTGGGDTPIPVALRGTTQTVAFRGQLGTASSNAARPQTSANSRFLIDLEFIEEATSV